MLKISLLGVVAIAASSGLNAQNPPPGFVYETLVDGPLDSVTAMAFLPDGRLLMTERETGYIRQFRDGALDPSPWATTPAVSGGAFTESGLLGIAVDPDFLNNRYVYVYYTNGNSESEIARLEEIGGLGTNLTVLTAPGAIAAQSYHNGGPMVFGHDGTLYVATGDALGAANAQSTQQWVGKVLRFDVPNLTVPANNPFPGSPVYSLGHRNHFGLAIHPVTGDLYQTENGGVLKDEINLILPGGNYGWPVYEGNEPFPDPAYVDPLDWYQPTTAPTGCCFYVGDQFPSLFRHVWFFTNYNENELRAVWFTGSGSSVANEVLFDDLPGAGYGVLTGPDGSLWYLTNDGGGYGADELGRYVYQHGNDPLVQLSAVSNRVLGGSLTVGVLGQNGDIAVPFVSWSRFAGPLSTPFGNLWVPGDAILPVMLLSSDNRAYVGLSVPNQPSFLGVSLHGQAITLRNGNMVLTNPSSLVLRG